MIIFNNDFSLLPKKFGVMKNDASNLQQHSRWKKK